MQYVCVCVCIYIYIYIYIYTYIHTYQVILWAIPGQALLDRASRTSRKRKISILIEHILYIYSGFGCTYLARPYLEERQWQVEKENQHRDGQRGVTDDRHIATACMYVFVCYVCVCVFGAKKVIVTLPLQIQVLCVRAYVYI